MLVIELRACGVGFLLWVCLAVWCIWNLGLFCTYLAQAELESVLTIIIIAIVVVIIIMFVVFIIIIITVVVVVIIFIGTASQHVACCRSVSRSPLHG